MTTEDPDKPKLKRLTRAIALQIKTGILALGCGVGATANADDTLPVPFNGMPAGGSAPELTVPELHPGIDTGHATADYSADGGKLTVNQTTDKAVLDWQSFDIAAGHAVQFVQPGSTSIALNNIHQADASKIFGALSANGQVYLINANGFLFGKNATVNTGSLLATNLKISDAVFEQGISKVVDSGNQEPIAALSGDGDIYRQTGNGTSEKIRILVEKGAAITAADGGRIVLAAPEIENQGTLSAPDGQVILAAATDKVYLQETDDPNLRGLLVEVETGGEVKNVGKILSERGNTTMLGFAVSQQGVISASTSVALNGSIRLLAREGATLVRSDDGQSSLLKPLSTHREVPLDDGLGSEAGVTLESGSVTTVALDDSGGSAVDGQAQPQSHVELAAGVIKLEDNASITAHGGNVTLQAGATPAAPLNSTGAGNSSLIQLAAGSRIDVSGVRNVGMEAGDNIVAVELFNDELRDSPIQKSGILHGQTVEVDIREGTPLADISGALAKIQHSVFERNTAAGTISLQSEGDVLIERGATLDISGGSAHYAGGFIETTQLVSRGSIYDISDADPNRTYNRIFSYRYFQPEYDQGFDAGTVDIKTRGLVLDGDILASTVNSLYQRDSDEAPQGGSLKIDTAWSNQPQQDVWFQNQRQYTDIAALSGILPPIYLGNALFAFGVNDFTLDSGGKFTVDGNSTLKLAQNGRLTVQAGEIEVNGTISSASGAITLKTQRGQDPGRNLSGDIRLGSAGGIDTSGSWINDGSDVRNRQPYRQLALDGGQISLQAQGDLLTAAGSRISANGGAWLDSASKLVAGKGGDISLVSAGLLPSQLQLGASLSSYSLTAGGELKLAANAISIGNVPAAPDGNTLALAADFLEQGGFSAYSLTANAGGIDVAAGIRIRLRQTNWQLKPTAYLSASGTELSRLAYLSVLPDDQRKPVDLSLNLAHNAGIAGGYDANRSINIGAVAAIVADPLANLRLESDANIFIDGTLTAHGGNIDLTLLLPPASIDSGFNPKQAIVLGGGARLDASGAPLLTPNTAGLSLGNVLAGGNIALTANRGYLLADTGSRIDVSGSQALLNIGNGRQNSKQTVVSNAGTIALTAAEGIFMQGGLYAAAGVGNAAGGGSSTAAGGTLSVELNTQHRGEPEDVVFTTADRVIHVSNALNPVLSDAQIAAAEVPEPLNGQAYISVRQIQDGGFSRAAFAASVVEPAQFSASPTGPERGEIRFDGDVDLALAQRLTFDAPLITGNATVTLSANTFSLGSSWNRAAHSALTTPPESGELTINANLIDIIGGSRLAGFAQTTLSSSGDIRLNGVRPAGEADLFGELTTAGDLRLQARSIYPTTFSRFDLNIDASANPDGSLEILATPGAWNTPFSAAGAMALNAPHIVSSGVLLAPYGSIDLNALYSLTLAAGSVTSVANDDGILIPFGRTEGGLDWVYPLGIYANPQDGTPQKTIALSAPDIDLAAGAKVNLNGGGDLSAFEFIPGPGGSRDVLAGSQSYAVLPAYQAGYAPYDPLEFAASGLRFGDSIYLSADSGLPAGNYVLLPAHYALLPSAFLITPQSGTTDMAAGTTSPRTDGALIVAGYRYVNDTPITDSRWSGFVVEPGSIALQRSEFEQHTASEFFAANQASSPLDAGNLSLIAEYRLRLAADISATAASGGLGGILDISATRLAVVDQFSSAPLGVELLAGELNKLDVDSLLLGGRRHRGNAADTTLTVTADTVTVAAGVSLDKPELILAASDSVRVEDGAVLAASATANRTDTRLDVANSDGSSDGALLRVSSAAQATVNRDLAALSGETGTLDIAAGARLSSNGSILFDASKDTVFAGQLDMEGGQLALNANTISLGDVGSDGGLRLSEAVLNGLRVDQLTLRSYGAIDIAGDINLQLQDLILDAAALRGYGTSGEVATIQASQITMTHEGAEPPALAAGSGSGTLRLDTGKLVLSGGIYGWSGFDTVNINASGSVVGNGKATIDADSNLLIDAPVWTADAGADTTLNLGGHDLKTAGQAASNSSDAVGARLTLNAGGIEHGGLIELASGIVTLNAGGTLDISGGIDTSGRSFELAGNLAYTGGSIVLASLEDLILRDQAVLDVSGSQAGGDAGGLQMSAAGLFVLDGTLTGNAFQNAGGGNFALDANTVSFTDFADLNVYLSGGDFNGDVNLRFRQGDWAVAAGDRVAAHNIAIGVDTGSLAIAGTLDAGGPQAGNIRLAAGDQVAIRNGAELTAVSSGNGKRGGSVQLISLDADGDQQQGVVVESGARIDVSGGMDGDGGTVDIAINRIENDDAAVSVAAGSVYGADSATVTATAHYRDAPLDNAQIQQWRAATQAYLETAGQNQDLLNRLGGLNLRPGLDISAGGDTALDLSETLTEATWTQQSTYVWTTKLDDVAGVVTALKQIGIDGAERTYTEAATSALSTSAAATSDGIYYFDANPQSPTFRTLFVRIFRNADVSAADRFNPNLISGDLVSSNTWDLAFPDQNGQSWHFGDVTGVLGLRTSGDLKIAGGGLSDGFALYDASQLADLLGVGGNWLKTWVLQTGESWSYNLVAGADLSAADPLAVQTSPEAGDLTIGTASSIRTGTGDINAAAAGDIRLTDWTSTIYTAGHTTETDRWGSLNPAIVRTGFFVDYPFDGGDVNLFAGRNVIGAASNQFISDWLQRTGNWDESNGISSQDRVTAWGIQFDGLVVQNSANAKIQNLKFGFRENIGALGGGNVTVKAKADITDLSVMLPTSAKPVGAVSANGLAEENSWQRLGGGDLYIEAGGDIAGGVFYVDRGLAEISAGGAITGGSDFNGGPVFALGDSQFEVRATNGISVGTVLNPFTLTQAKFLDKTSYFTTYSPDSSISFQTLAGDLTLLNDVAPIVNAYKIFDQTSPNGRSILKSTDYPLLTLYPGNLAAQALSGNLAIAGSMALFPAAYSSLDLLAANNIVIGNPDSGTRINQLDVDPENLLSPYQPATTTAKATQYLYTSPTGGDLSTVHAATPVHTGDSRRNRIVAANGSLTGIGDSLIAAAKASVFSAGRDFFNLSLMLQNLGDADVSSVTAGRDIKFPILRDAATGAVDGSPGQIQLAGPGLLYIGAGRNIDLGSSEGITTVGPILNPSLSPRGADIIVTAGSTLDSDPTPIDSFLAHYIDGGAYAGKAADLARQTGKEGKLALALDILFAEIRASAQLAATSGGERGAAYQRGYAAIAKLFPTANPGDIVLFFSRIQTLFGGDINLLLPDGMLNVGLATAFSGQKSEDRLGIVAQREGDIGIMADQDVQVNQSRIFTLDGGDITIWSSNGNIDAGRGAKSSIATPPPTVTTDANGNIIVDFPATVSGKGIRAQSGFNASRIGSVTLAAPRGVINAGEAGIGGRNITVAASAIIGASNIQALDSSVGTPQTPAVVSVSADVAGSATAAAKSAESSTSAQANEISDKPNKPATKVAVLHGQLIGFGSCSVTEVRDNQLGCGN